MQEYTHMILFEESQQPTQLFYLDFISEIFNVVKESTKLERVIISMTIRQLKMALHFEG
jgi:hypothetical protein